MGMAAAAAWDVLAKAANLAQMSGLHAAMLVAVLTSILRVHQRNKRECARLERCHRRLRALLQWPTTTTGGITLLLCTETGEDPFGKALGDAAGLVDDYRKSTVWRRIRSGGSTATKLRDMHDILNSYCGLLLFINAHLLFQQHAAHHHHAVAPSPDTSTTTIPEADDDMSQSPSAQAVTSPSAPGNRETHRANGIGLRGIDTDPATGCETDVPALLPIVISQA